MALAGYSRTSLPKKLGIKEGHTVVLVGAPTSFELGPLPTGEITTHRVTETGPFDVFVVFVKKRIDLVKQLAACRPKLAQNGGLC
jgi:hypothetical protein